MATRDIQMSNTTDNYKFVRCWDNPGEDNFTGLIKDINGNIAYYENGKWHRTDGPALIFTSGSKFWLIHGKKHREDGPAVQYFDSNKYWYYNDECYGIDDKFTIESWIKFCKLEIFK